MGLEGASQGWLRGLPGDFPGYKHSLILQIMAETYLAKLLHHPQL